MSKAQTRSKFKWQWGEMLHPFLLRRRYLDWKFNGVEDNSVRYRFKYALPRCTLLTPNKELYVVKDFLTHWLLSGENNTTLTLYLRSMEYAKNYYDLEELKSASAFIFDDLSNLDAPKSTTYEIKFKAASEDWNTVEFDILKTSTRTFDPIN